MKNILKKVGIVIVSTVIVLLIGAYGVMWICVNGPSPLAKELFVLSVRESSAGGFLADIYCTDEEIEAIEKKNSVVETDEITDTSIIKIPKPSTLEGEDKPQEDEEQIVEAFEYVDGICVEDISGATFNGKMMIIKDPSRVFVGALPKYGDEIVGNRVGEFIERYGATAGTNAGGFKDVGGNGTGGVPEGIVISEGELKSGGLNNTYEVIGITKENVLVVGNMTAKKAMDMGVRDAVSFGPILIVNGNPATVGGTGGGLNPRTAIGQRADGAVLLLVVDGRQASSLGASMNDLINVMLEYGAVNAANLDGGSSTRMIYKGEQLNSSASLIGDRPMPTAILVR